MNLDVSPADVLAQTKTEKMLLLNILRFAAWLDDNLDPVWRDYHTMWDNLNTAAQDAAITIMADKTKTPMSARALDFHREYIALLLKTQTQAVRVGKLKEREAALTSQLAVVRAEIAQAEK